MPSQTSMIIFFALPLFVSVTQADVPPAQQEIKVTLFGQPCIMEGPFLATTLREIHAISPEQVPAKQNLATLKNTIVHVKQTKGVPSQLDAYRARLLRRLEAQFTFLEQYVVLKRTGNANAFLEAVTPHLSSGAAPFKTKFAEMAAKAPPKKWKKTDLEELTNIFELGIEPYPEEAFHQSIDRLKVRYNCSFDEAPTGNEEE
mgnify:CR=1 FL=1